MFVSHLYVDLSLPLHPYYSTLHSLHALPGRSAGRSFGWGQSPLKSILLSPQGPARNHTIRAFANGLPGCLPCAGLLPCAFVSTLSYCMTISIHIHQFSKPGCLNAEKGHQVSIIITRQGPLGPATGHCKIIHTSSSSPYIHPYPYLSLHLQSRSHSSTMRSALVWSQSERKVNVAKCISSYPPSYRSITLLYSPYLLYPVFLIAASYQARHYEADVCVL